jgi:hypothetical protein
MKYQYWNNNRIYDILKESWFTGNLGNEPAPHHCLFFEGAFAHLRTMPGMIGMIAKSNISRDNENDDAYDS